MKFFTEILLSRYFLIFTFCLALVLPLPSIDKGLQTDDYLHWSILNPSALPKSNLKSSLKNINNLFSFINPLSNEYTLAKTMGTLPWWTSPELKINFWRPLAAFTYWLDYQSWPNNTVFMHLHNILWYVLLLLACFYFYKTFAAEEPLSKIIIPLACLLFCLDFSNYANISWLANRNSLICALMCVLALLMHHQWRTQHDIKLLIISQSFVLLAMAANESGLIAFLWITAYNFVYEKNALKEKLLASTPVFITLIVWQLLYKYLGFGFSNSGLYLHPINDFLIVSFSIIEKLPIFIFSQIFGIEGFYNGFSPHIRYLVSTSCIFITIIFVITIIKSISLNRTIVFLSLCMILAFVPASAFALMEIRMSIYAGIPSAFVFSYIISHGLNKIFYKKTEQKKPIALAICIAILIFAHLVLSSAQWALQWKGFSFNNTAQLSNISYLIKPLLSNNPNTPYKNKDLVILGAPSAIDYFYLPYVAHYHSLNMPRSINLLTLNYVPYKVSMENERTLRLTSTGLLLNRYSNRNTFISEEIFSVWYALHDLNSIFLPVDSNIEQNMFGGADFYPSIHEKNKNNQIKNISFTFDNNLKNENYIFLYWNKDKYTEISFKELKESGYTGKGI